MAAKKFLRSRNPGRQTLSDPPLLQPPPTIVRIFLIKTSALAVMTNKQLSENEIWDDSALVQSWNDALEEYRVNNTFSV